ncbi:hypothetical protein WJX74_004820 [Apatococcus lobatus]|uniref:AAA+ ATPase domain-containing protein n=1 Tax=Apatococcus lobatus TaxID=904363 RepID=A0AAW1SBC3_9CHLO
MGQGRRARAAQDTQSSNPDSQEQGKVRRKSTRLKDSAETHNKAEEPAGKRKRAKADTIDQNTSAKKQHGMQQEGSTDEPALLGAPPASQPKVDGAAAVAAELHKAETPSDSREAQCKGSPALQSTPPEGRSSRNEEPHAPVPLGNFWGCLISLLPQHPSIEMSSTTMFGRGSECHVRLDDPRMPAKLFRIKMDADSDQACLRNFGAVPGQANPLISVNGRYLSQSEEVNLRGGDDVVVHSRHPYAFVYATPAELTAHKQGKPAAVAPADRADNEAMEEAAAAAPEPASEPESELPTDLLEAFKEGLARLAPGNQEAGPNGLAAANESDDPGPPSSSAPEDERHAPEANAAHGADHHLHVLAEACYNHSGDAGGSGGGEGDGQALLGSSGPRGDPSADAPDPAHTAELGGHDHQVMVAAGEGRPIVILPSRGPGQGIPMLQVHPSSAAPPSTRHGKGTARSAQGKSGAAAGRGGGMRASAVPAASLRMWLPGLGPASQGRGPPTDLVSYLTWAASHAPPMGGPLLIPGTGRHAAKGIPKLGHPKGKGVAKPKARAPAAPPPTSPRRKRARKTGMDLRPQRTGVPTEPQGTIAKASEEEVLREALGGLAKQVSGSAEPMDTEAPSRDASTSQVANSLTSAVIRDDSSPLPPSAKTLVERILQASSAGQADPQPGPSQPLAAPMNAAGAAEQADPQPPPPIAAASAEAAGAAEQPTHQPIASAPMGAPGEAGAAAGLLQAQEAAATAVEAAKEAERAKYIPTVLDCSSPNHHKSRLKYWVADGAWEVLRRTAQLHLKHPEGAKCLGFEEGLIFKGASQFVLLSGPSHSELCQEACLRAVAHEMGAQLMVTDCAQLCPDGSWRLPYMTTHSHVNRGPWVVQPDADAEMDEDEWDAYEDELEWAASAGLPPPPAPYGSAYPGYPPAHPYPPPSFLQTCPYKLSDRVFWTHHGSQAAPAGQAAPQPTSNLPGQPPALPKPSSRLASALRLMRSAQGGEPAGSRAPSTRKSLIAQIAPPPAHPQLVAGTLPVPGPPAGSSGTVLITFPDNPQRVGVRFDTPFPGGVNLGGQCGEGEGAICMTTCLQAGEGTSSTGPETSQEQLPSALDIVFDTAIKACTTKPTILLLKSARSVMSNATDQSEGYNHFSACLDRAEQPLEDGAPTHKLLVVASMTQPSKASPKVSEGSGAFLSAMFSSGTGDALAIDGIPKDGKDRIRVRSEAKAMEHLKVLFPNQIKLTAPSSQPQLGKWRRQMEEDGAQSRATSNRHTIQTVVERCHIGCSQLSKLTYREQKLDREAAERLVAWAIAAQLEAHPEQTSLIQLHEHQCDFDLQLSHLQAALEVLKFTQEAEAVNKKVTLDVQTDNDFEKKLLAEVIPPGEVGIGFGDIGALDNVKSTLREVVMLPLKRPELFMRGQLTKPTKGVLLFGPPGTGKTMLAKAVASESGANFISVGPSSLGSKWFGEAEKYVKALFTLAHKIAPCVIFVDEVDSLLGRRDKSGEHEAMRKMKTEFMAAWDGLRTNQYDRVLVLAATNRPGDLDEAVVRRMPRRLMVDLPDAANRAKILKVILKEEQLAPGFNAEEVASLTDGYSGSDLKNLCIAAAYRPIRDFLAAENAAGPSDLEVSTPAAAPAAADLSGAPGVTPPTQAAAELARQSAGEEEAAAPATAGMSQGSAEAASAAAEGDGELKAADLRALTVKDFQEAMKQVGSSASEDAFSMGELKQWNELYGEGGSRRSKLLSYFS